MAATSSRVSVPAREFREAEQFFRVDLQALNGSGVTGEVLIAFDEDTGKLTVVVNADGLEPNQVHIQHIHGFADDGDPSTPRIDATIPDASDDTDGDGFIELLEGVPDYGPILLNVGRSSGHDAGGDNGHSHDGPLSGFPTAPDGSIRFADSFLLPSEQGLAPDTDFSLYHFVIHGMSTGEDDGEGTTGEVDGTPGYKLVLPVAIGDLQAIDRDEALDALGATRRDFARDYAEARRDAAAARREERMNDGADASAATSHGDWMF